MLHSLRCAAVLLLALGIVTACSQRSTRSAPVDRNLITRAEIEQFSITNAYDAVARLHGNWLVTKGTDSFVAPGQVWVYHDNVKIGGVESLRDIPTVAIGHIRYYTATDATARWGLDHGHGVIYVSSYKEDDPRR